MQEEEHNSIQHGKPKQQNNYRTRSKNKVIDWFEFNGTFSMNRLYCDFEKYVAVKKVKLMRKLATLSVGNAHN